MNDQPYFRAIMMTDRVGRDWTQPRAINGELWSEGYSFPTSLSMDGNELYLVTKKGFDGDIYVSHYKDGKWSPMKPLNEEINSEYFETHASISPDGRELYFTSDRPGGQGGLDIYISERVAGDEWGPPRNLGPKVNSFYSEETPFITTDNKSLFFSSQGHTTMGGYDIFYSDRLPDASWSVPANIGYPVNTTDDDLFFVPRKTSKQALYSLVIPEQNPARAVYSVSLGEADLEVKIGIRSTDQPEQEDSVVFEEVAVAVRQVETDAATGGQKEGVPDTGSRRRKDSNGGQPEDKGSGTRTGEVAAVTTEESGTSDAAVSDIAETGRTLLPPDPGKEYYVLNSMFFDFDDYGLNDAAKAEVRRLLTVMKKYPDLRLEVTGHTDARGAADYNLLLSEKRAQAVVDYLVANGIDAGRLAARGVGEADPVAVDYLEDGTDSPEGRKLNRHVDLRLHNLNSPDIEVADIFVPDHLRPRNDYDYSVLLQQSDHFIDTLPDKISGEDIALVIIGNQYLYTAGNFDNRIEAVKLLNHAIDSGFPEAQLMEKRQLEALVASLIKDEVSPVVTFTIQFIALKEPKPLSYFKNLQPVTKFEGRDGLTRYVYGEFREIDVAFDELEKVRNKGYHDAFIMYMARYRAPGNQ